MASQDVSIRVGFWDLEYGPTAFLSMRRCQSATEEAGCIENEVTIHEPPGKT